MRARVVLARISGTLIGVGAVAFVLVAVTGAATGIAPVVVAVPLVAVVLWPGLRSRLPHRAVADGWVDVPAFQPAAPHAVAPSGRVALALAGPESRELALSPAFGAGIAFCLVVVVMFGLVFPDDSGGELADVAELAAIFAHPLVGMVLLAAHRARSRSVRDGTEELLEACPTSQSTRTVGHLATAWLPAALALALGAGMVLLVRSQVDVSWGGFGARQWVAILGAAVLAIGGTALGVGLGRAAPWTIVPIAVLIAIAVLTIELATAGGNDQREPLRQLSTFLGDSDVDLRFTAPHYVAHLGWLAALTAIVVLLAVLRDRRSPSLLAGVAVASVAAVGFGVAAVQPIDDADAQRIAAVLDDLPAHQSCVDAGGIDVCTFAGDEDLARAVAGEVAPVLAAAPAGAADGFSFRSGATTDRFALDPEVYALLDPPDPTELPVELSGHGDALQGARLWAALAATGVLDGWTRGTTRGVAHQARGVASLWLATRGAGQSATRELTSYDPAADGDVWRPWPDPCYAGPTPVVWAVSDVMVARQLLAVDAERVEELLARRWDWVTDPTTSTNDLAIALGLEPVTPSGALTRTASC
jgi:hypothetical protein